MTMVALASSLKLNISSITFYRVPQIALKLKYTVSLDFMVLSTCPSIFSFSRRSYECSYIVRRLVCKCRQIFFFLGKDRPYHAILVRKNKNFAAHYHATTTVKLLDGTKPTFVEELKEYLTLYRA